MKYIQIIFGYLTVFAIASLLFNPLYKSNFNIWILLLVVLTFDIQPLKDSDYPFGFALEFRFQIRY